MKGMKLIISSGEKGSRMQVDERDETDDIKRENRSIKQTSVSSALSVNICDPFPSAIKKSPRENTGGLLTYI